MKKLISLFTTICIVFGVLGTFTVFAQDSAAELEIGTLAQLEAFRDDVNSGNTYEGKTVRLTADIDMSKKYGEGKLLWESIGINSWPVHKPFCGTFDGNGHKIKNLYGGDFFDLSEGIIKNLKIESGTVFGYDTVGGVVGLNNGTVENCYNTAVVSIIHKNRSDSNSLGGVCGGVVGGNSSNGTMKNCYNAGNISGGDSIGGVVGLNYAKVENCYNIGTVSGNSETGGVVGANSHGIVENCYSIGAVSGIENVGGVVGSNVAEADMSIVENCYNMGAVSGTENVGGVVGFNDEGTTITNCYYLSGTADKGIAVVGEGGTDTTTALTTEQFADKSNFTNWDFDTVWKMDETLKRPVLRSATEEPPTQPHTHILVHQTAKAATCTEMGNREYWQCSGCGNVFEDEEATREIDGIPTIDATGHTEVTDAAIEPTCETDGKTAGSHCSVCNTVITEQTIIPKLNHNWGAWSITIEPTLTATGKAERICINDNTHKEIVDLPILTDTKIWTDGLKIEPTETEKGSVTYTSQYGNVTIIIPALNPEYDYIIKYENEKAVVTVPKDGTYTIIFAAYDNGRLLSVNAQDIQLVKGENPPISPQNFNANGKIKVMLWNSLTDMQPLCMED